MHIQVVCCHPLTDSFDHALFRTEERRTYMDKSYATARSRITSLP